MDRQSEQGLSTLPLRQLQLQGVVLEPEGGMTFTGVWRARKVSAPTNHHYQKLYSRGKAVADKRFKELQKERPRFNRLFADAGLDTAMH